MLGGGLSMLSSASTKTRQHFSLEFDGVNDYVSGGGTTDGIFQHGTDDHTIAFWIKKHSGSNWYGSSGGSTTDCYVVSQYLNANDKAMIAFIRDSSSGNTRIHYYNSNDGTSNLAINLQSADNTDLAGLVGEWIHVLISIDRSANAVIYINGAVNSTTDISSTSSKTTLAQAATTYIARDAQNNRYCKFTLYNLTDWNVALDADNAAAVYNNGMIFRPLYNSGDYDQASNLNSYYTFDGKGASGLNYSPFSMSDMSGALRTYPAVKKTNSFNQASVPTVGSNVVTSSLAASHFSTVYGNTSVSDQGADGVKIAHVDNALGAIAPLGAANIFPNVVGGTYELTMYVKTLGSGMKVGIFFGDLYPIYTGAQQDEFVKIGPLYFYNQLGACYIWAGVTFQEAGDAVWIKDVEIKRVGSSVLPGFVGTNAVGVIHSPGAPSRPGAE